MSSVSSQVEDPTIRRQAAELYRRYSALCFLRARRILGSDADDVVQEVFVRLLGNPPATLSADSPVVRAWLIATTTNVCTDRLRHKLRRDQGWRKALQAHVQPGAAADAESRVFSVELLRAALGEADEQTSQIVALAYFDELNQEEIAALLGVGRKTVAKRLGKFQARARRLLRT
jgi:RNA polymerase sigma factor (sigma-70 family)